MRQRTGQRTGPSKRGIAVVFDPLKREGAVKAEVNGHMSSRLMEIYSGASVWRSSSWARRALGSVRVSGEIGSRGRVSQTKPREERVADMVCRLTHDFRSGSVPQRVEQAYCVARICPGCNDGLKAESGS